VYLLAAELMVFALTSVCLHCGTCARSLKNNVLASLPPDTFHSLASLRMLYVEQTAAVAAVADNVAGADKVTGMLCRDLNNNTLASLPTGIFDSLKGVWQLYVL